MWCIDRVNVVGILECGLNDDIDLKYFYVVNLFNCDL